MPKGAVIIILEDDPAVAPDAAAPSRVILEEEADDDIVVPLAPHRRADDRAIRVPRPLPRKSDAKEQSER